jgi:hypothetical protein
MALTIIIIWGLSNFTFALRVPVRAVSSPGPAQSKSTRVGAVVGRWLVRRARRRAASGWRARIFLRVEREVSAVGAGRGFVCGFAPTVATSVRLKAQRPTRNTFEVSSLSPPQALSSSRPRRHSRFMALSQRARRARTVSHHPRACRAGAFEAPSG